MNEIENRRILYPWIGSGMAGAWRNWKDALVQSGLDYIVDSQKLWNPHPESREELPDAVSNYIHTPPSIGCSSWLRGDHIATVTPDYNIIQNEEAFSLFDSIPNYLIVAAGETANGMCFMVAEIDTHTIRGEDYKQYVLAVNSHNKKYQCCYMFTSVRIICQNMYAKLYKVPNKFMIKHTSKSSEKMLSLGAFISQSNSWLDCFTNIAENMQSRALPSNYSLEEITSLIFPEPVCTTESESKRFETYKFITQQKRDDWVRRYYNSPTNHMHTGTSFGLLNAYYDFVSHDLKVEPRKNTNADNAIFEGLVSGKTINDKVLKHINEL